MLLSFDVDADAIPEHDHWHTHRHLPERLSIPGFLRGTRWVALEGEPRYMVLYEVQSVSTLTSEAYLQRLDNPTPWTSKIMPGYRRMSRGLCSVLGSFGRLRPLSLCIRFKARKRDELHSWLLEQVLPALPLQPGLGSAHLLEATVVATMTMSSDSGARMARSDLRVLVTGYDDAAVDDAGRTRLGASVLAQHGAEDLSFSTYQVSYSLARVELDASRRRRRPGA
jgi:hypothetical protein